MRLVSIQILRGLAALFVVIFHVNAIEVRGIAESKWVLENGQIPEPAFVSGLWHNGFVGVDLFFVISGFIMVYVTRNLVAGRSSVFSFLFARISRIYPIWWFFASIMLAYFWVTIGAPGDPKRVAQADSTMPLYLLHSYLLVPQAAPPVLGVGWTLVHEMYFYFGFALLLFLPKSIRAWACLAWGALVAVGAGLGLSGPLADTYISLIFHPMTLEFILGGIAAALIASGRIWRPGLLLVVSCVWLAAAMQFVLPPSVDNPDWSRHILEWGRVLYFGPPCVLAVYAFAGLEAQDRLNTFFLAIGAALGCVMALIFAGASAGLYVRAVAGFAGAALGFAAVRWLVPTVPAAVQLAQTGLKSLGDWSYSLYLSHILVLSGWRQLFPMIADVGEQNIGLPTPLVDLLRLGREGVLDNILFLLVAVTSSVFVSWLTYRYVERPLTRYFGQKRRQIFTSE